MFLRRSLEMEDYENMPTREALARREAMLEQSASLIGKLIFGYSRFVTNLHLCVAWFEFGQHLEHHAEIAEDLGVAKLLKMIEEQARHTLGKSSAGYSEYAKWLRAAHRLRENRNLIVHSRWGVDSFGRHMIAVSTPVFVEPAKEHVYTAEMLSELFNMVDNLIARLNQLRKKYPL